MMNTMKRKKAITKRIESLIEQAEIELADLRLRKAIMEADFDELCHHYQTLIIGNQDISIIAKRRYWNTMLMNS